MRLLTGLILGIALTIGGAWIVDNSREASEPKLVNWTQVEKSFTEARQNVMVQWKKLSG